MKRNTYLIEMGKKIKAARNERELSVRRLGELCELDYGYISRLEGGQFNPHLLTLKNIADKLNVDVKDFI